MRIANAEPNTGSNNRRFTTFENNTMKNTELEKLANCITFSGSRGKAEFIQDVSFFMKQVKEKSLEAFNEASTVLIFQGKQGVGKSRLVEKISSSYSLSTLISFSTLRIKDALIESSVVELAEIFWLSEKWLVKLKEFSTLTKVHRRDKFLEGRMSVYPVIGSLICTSTDIRQLEEGRRLKPFIIEAIDFEAINAIDISKIYETL